MSPMDSGRLVRALGLGALVFLVLGGGIGLAAAQGENADEGRTEAAVIPMPRIGDRALYDLVEVDGDGDPVRRSALTDATFAVEWLGARDVPAPDLTVRQAHVLGITYRSPRYEEAADLAFDAATGVPLGHGRAWSTPYSYEALAVPVVSSPEAEGTIVGRIDSLQAPLAPCGLRADLQGRSVEVGDEVTVFGACDAEGQGRATTFRVHGWEDIDGRRLLRIDEVDGLGLRMHYDPLLPFPVRAEGKFPGYIDHGFAEDRTFALHLDAFHAGAEAYQPVAAAPVGPAPQLARAPLTPWIVEDDGVDHAFPLSEAYAAALDPAKDPNSEQTVRDFLEGHPDAYLAFAWSFHTEDGQGTPYPAWALAWSDGDDYLAKAALQYPALLVAEVGLLPPETAVQDLPTEFGDGFFPPKDRLPWTLPTIASLWPRSADVLGPMMGAEPNSYGFLAVCADGPCSSAIVAVHAGYTWMPASNPWNLEATIQDQSAAFGLVAVDQDARPLFTIFLHGDQRAPVSVLPPTAAPPAGEGHAAPLATSVLNAWAAPGAEAAAGVGMFALLASAAYYFWPALKGGAVGLFSRIEPERVLDHPARKNLHVLVEANPGIHFQELVRRTGFGRGQLEHHLRKLEHAELVSRVKGDSYACFFARGQVDRRVMAAAPLLRSDGGRGILAALHQRPGASSRELAAQLGLAVGTVSYHVKRLREAGMLESAGGALHLTETGRQATSLAA